MGALVSDNPKARALELADRYNVPSYTVELNKDEEKEEYEERIHIALDEQNVSLVSLAGYMRIVSPYLIDHYEQSMMNIHPSLLPSFKGLNAQKKALEYGVKVAGCTVHYVWNEVDSGPIILQQAVPVREDDSNKTLSNRILIHEHRLYSKAIQLHVDGRLNIEDRKVKIDYSGGWEEDWKERESRFIEHQKQDWKGKKVYGDVFR